MTIKYTAGLTLEEQLRHWESGSDEEHKLAKWLLNHLIDIEDQQGQDIDEVHRDAWQEGYDDGYSDALTSQGVG